MIDLDSDTLLFDEQVLIDAVDAYSDESLESVVDEYDCLEELLAEVSDEIVEENSEEDVKDIVGDVFDQLAEIRSEKYVLDESTVTDLKRDNKTVGAVVTEDDRETMFREKIGEDYQEKILSGDHKEELAIYHDDTFRSTDEAAENAIQGYIAEAVFARVLDEHDIEYEWKGGDCEPDFVLGDDFTVDVKARGSYDNEFRCLLRDESIQTSKEVDALVLTQTTLDHQQNQINYVEFLGYVLNDTIEEQLDDNTPLVSEQELYWHDESEKIEVTPAALQPIPNLFDPTVVNAL